MNIEHSRTLPQKLREIAFTLRCDGGAGIASWRSTACEEAADEIQRQTAISRGESDLVGELRAEIERLRGCLSAAAINITTASIVIEKLGSEQEAAPFRRAANQMIAELDSRRQAFAVARDRGIDCSID